jgi:hypothetical protein
MENDIAEVIADINKISTLINIQGKHTVFVNGSGHVKKVEIKLYLGGWESGSEASLSEDISYDEYWGLEESLKKFKKVRDTLYKIYKNGKINMENCSYEIEEIKHYKFI